MTLFIGERIFFKSVNFALPHGIDMIALSFTRTGADIEHVRDLLGPRAHHC